MIRRLKEWLVNFRALVLAIAVHLVAAGILFMNLEWDEPKPAAAPAKAPMQVTTVDKAVVDQELAKIDLAEKEREAERQQKLKEEEQKLVEIEKKRKAEEERLANIQRKKEQEKKKAAEEKRKQELAAKKARERKLAEQKEKERKARELAEKKKREAAAKKERERKLAEEKKRKAAEAKRQQELAAQKQREQELQAALVAEATQARVAHYETLIKEHVTNNWYIPATAQDGMRCILLVRLFPTGEVQTVQVVSSSGNAAFDKSVEDAIYRASPLPVPPPAEGLFHENFREFHFDFHPRNLKG